MSGKFILGFLGVLIVFGSFVLLVCCEYSIAATHLALTQTTVTDIDPESPKITDGVVHVSGQLVSNDTLSDPLFGFESKGIRLTRHTQMLQWKQSSTSEHSEGSSADVQTYHYSTTWSSTLISSSSFHESSRHENPTEMFPSATFTSSEVTLGSLKLSPELISKLPGDVACPIPTDYELPPRATIIRAFPGEWYFPVTRGTSQEVGDQRVSYSLVPAGPFTFMAELHDGTLSPWDVGSASVQTGIHSHKEMMDSLLNGNLVGAWLLRIFNAFLMLVGLLMIQYNVGIPGFLLYPFGFFLFITPILCIWILFHLVYTILFIALLVGAVYWLTTQIRSPAHHHRT